MWFGRYRLPSTLIAYTPSSIVEECGLLLGRPLLLDYRHRRLRLYVEEVAMMKNRSKTPEDQFEIWNVDTTAEAHRRTIGVWHSHPDGDPDPSECDCSEIVGRFRFGVITTPNGWLTIYDRRRVIHQQIALTPPKL